MRRDYDQVKNVVLLLAISSPAISALPSSHRHHRRQCVIDHDHRFNPCPQPDKPILLICYLLVDLERESGTVGLRRHLSMTKSPCYVVRIYPSPRPKLMYVKKRVNGKITLKKTNPFYIYENI